MLFMMRATVSVAVLPVLTSGESAQDAWASSLVVILGTGLIVLMIGGLGVRFKEKTVIQYSIELLGKPLGAAVSVSILSLLLHFAATDARIYAEVLISGFIPLTPLTFVVGTMVILAAITVYLGVEVIGRCADVLTPLFVLFIVLGIAAGFAAFDSRMLEPVLARGAKPVLSGALTPLGLGGKYLPLAMLIPCTTKPSRALATALVSVLLAGGVLVGLSLMVVGVLGPDLGTNAIFPFFKALRSVRVTHLLQRAEALAVVSWGFGVFIDLSMFLYCGSRGVSQLLGLKDGRFLLGPMAVVWVAYSMHAYEALLDISAFHQPRTFLPFVAATMLVPYIFLWTAYGIRTLKARRDRGRQP